MKKFLALKSQMLYLTFMSRINFVLGWVEHEKGFITSVLKILEHLPRSVILVQLFKGSFVLSLKTPAKIASENAIYLSPLLHIFVTIID